MCSFIGLWTLANIVQGRMGREWLITILRPRTQSSRSTGKMSGAVMLVAAVMDLLTWALHRRLTFLI